MSHIEIYSSDNCPWCAHAKSLLRSQALEFKEINVSSDQALLLEMIERSGQRTVPQVFINGEAIGGFDELSKINLSALREQAAIASH